MVLTFETYNVQKGQEGGGEGVGGGGMQLGGFILTLSGSFW